ncbi:DNA cytosine methyltransferase [Bacillus velezensis]|uniref:DNA cytosine methyltransferase n=1 Tax=Bacillus velezensis TaxID=492670 RepID=UPI001F46B95C|nr:DNA cytosine methyltransferase [Bacillus velezensis]MCE4941087.1 DNA cytosine methyltransferase [Bacillus velezensis]
MTNIPNHDPKPLSERVINRMQSGGYETYFKKHPVGKLDKPAYTVTAHYAKGAPDGLVDILDKERSEYMGDFNLTPQQPANGLTVLELFCGGGLGAIGFKAAGFDIVKALDFDENAVKAYRHNFGDYVEQADINEIDIDSLPNTDVIFGGPPCQDFSVAGKGAGADGERGKLVWRYLEIIERKQPKAFVFENVKGLITKRHRPTFDALIEKFNEIGYEISWQVVNAWHYGVAQKRERVFIVGVRKALGLTFEFPKPLEGDYQTRVLRDVIGDLPEPASRELNPQDGRYSSQYLSRNRVVPWDSPAFTVLTNPRDASIHPADGSLTMEHVRNGTRNPRRFTVRECLRIQSAPDTYVLPDDISLSAQYRIVGNGIASRVAWYIGRALADQLRFKSKA